MKLLRFFQWMCVRFHFHNWKVMDYERKEAKFYRKYKFRSCGWCGVEQEKRNGVWGPIVNRETYKEMQDFDREFRASMDQLKRDFDRM